MAVDQVKIERSSLFSLKEWLEIKSYEVRSSPDQVRIKYTFTLETAQDQVDQVYFQNLKKLKKKTLLIFYQYFWSKFRN